MEAPKALQQDVRRAGVADQQIRVDVKVLLRGLRSHNHEPPSPFLLGPKSRQDGVIEYGPIGRGEAAMVWHWYS
jgi:hypothetical protein